MAWTSHTIRFQEVKWRAQKNLPCPDCGKRVKRSTTFEQTVNPWNKNAAGDPKTVAEIRAELEAESAAWRMEPVQCRSCREASEGGCVVSAVRKGDKARVSFVVDVEDVDDHGRVMVACFGEGVGRHRVVIPADASVELVERADDPAKNELGTLRLEQHDDDPGHSVWLCTMDRLGRRAWYCVYSTAVGNQGGRLEDDEVVGLPVVGSLFGTPAAEAEMAPCEFQPRVAELDHDSGYRWRETPAGTVERTANGGLSWHDSQYESIDDVLACEVAHEVTGPRRPVKDAPPLPEREPRVFPSDGPEPPEDVVKLEAENPHCGWTHLERDGDRWRWTNDSGRAFGAIPWPANASGLLFREVRS